MQYMVSVIVDSQTTDESTDALATAKEMADIDVFNQRLIDEGYWVFAGGLAAPTTSTVIDSRGTQPIFTDGPFVETKEWVAGLWIWEAPDLDVALKLAVDGSKACNRKLEVRPLLENPE
ncbi:MAG TPA: YciI family protein [Galbitalea sp.]|jgi:hypothetical protein